MSLTRVGSLDPQGGR